LNISSISWLVTAIKPDIQRRTVTVASIYAWWLWLSAGYLLQYWRNPLIGGADGAGHVALLHLYQNHIYPDVQGWIPEFFGGMPFPVYYPPLFYWLGATIMSFGGVSATIAVKIIATSSFLAIPLALFRLCRSLDLSLFQATLAVAWSGIIMCGSNAASLGGIGLLGLFEVGLYTQTLGFLWLIIWCGSLPNWRASKLTVLTAILALTESQKVSHWFDQCD
jgi:hypothetical protein